MNSYPPQFESQNNVKEISLPTLLLSFLFCAPTPPNATPPPGEPLDQLLIFLPVYTNKCSLHFPLSYKRWHGPGEFSLSLQRERDFPPPLLLSFLSFPSVLALCGCATSPSRWHSEVLISLKESSCLLPQALCTCCFLCQDCSSPFPWLTDSQLFPSLLPNSTSSGKPTLISVLLVQGLSLPPSNFPHSRILSPFMMILFSICLPHLITPVLLPMCYHCPQGTWHSLAG